MGRRHNKPQKPLWPVSPNYASQQWPGLVGWWPGNGSGGILRDCSGRNNHGMLTNFAAPFTATSGWAPGYQGGNGALAFDGTNDYVNVGTPSALAFEYTDKFSIDAWIRTPTTTAYSNVTFVSKILGVNPFTGYALASVDNTHYTAYLINSTGGAYIRVDFPRLNNTLSQHVRMTYSGNGLASGVVLRVNGIVQPPTVVIDALSGSSILTSANVCISSNNGGSAWASAEIEDVKIHKGPAALGIGSSTFDPATRWSLRWTPTRAAWSFPAAVGIVYDASSNSGYQTAASSYSWSHTCTGSNRGLAVDISLLSVPGTTVSGITYNGIALSFVGAKSTVSGAGRVEQWFLANPASGTNTIAVTLSAAVGSAGTAVSYTGVHQTSPTEAFNSAQATNVGATDATVSITTVAVNDWVHGAIATSDTAITANQTSRNNVTGAAGSGANEDTGPIASPGATTISYTDVGALATWAIAGYAIRPTTASGLGNRRRRIIIASGVN